MNITCVSRETKTYDPIFGTAISVEVAYVEFDIPGEGVTTMGFSHRTDDPEGMWLADSRIGPNGYPVFVHGEGDRVCDKQIAGPQIVEAILAYTD